MFDRIKLQNFIKQKNLRRNSVAIKAGIDTTSFYLILSGKRKCSIEEYLNICNALSVPINSFIVQNNISKYQYKVEC